MREILFRGKRVDNGEWVEGSLILTTSTKEKAYVVDSCYCYDGCINEDGYADFDRLNAFEVIPETVGQFTGLTDKNGKKIFEGDIVDILTENEEIGVVAYDDGGFLVNADGFCVDFHANINGTDLEIISNIHDNPELLKGGDENA